MPCHAVPQLHKKASAAEDVTGKEDLSCVEMAGPARGTGIVGSMAVELEKSYRIMLLKVARELTIEDCQQIAFVAKLPSPTCIPEPGKTAINLHMMNTLESLGKIGPLKFDYLEVLLDAIGKNCLLETIDSYKKTSVYREAKKRHDDQEKKKKKISGKKLKNRSDPSSSGYSVEAQELLAIKADHAAEKRCKLKESYATLLTQFSQVALLLRSAIESDDLTHMEETFMLVASDGDAITRTLRKNLSAAGIKCGSSSDSSSMDSPVHSPTDSEVQLLGTAYSPPQAVGIHNRCHPAAGPSQEASPSPSAQRKKPIPLPRTKWPKPESSGIPVSSPILSPNMAPKFVFCQQESHQAPSALTAAMLHIPQSASTSCLTCTSDYSGDYSGGTGDSGVGDIKSKYMPSKEALDQLMPRQQQPSEASQAQTGGADQRSRYMKLKTFEEKSSDGYTKPLRAGSMEDFLQMKDSHRYN